MKEVYFNDYCYRCKNLDKKEESDPCYDCLAEPVREDSHIPIKYDPFNDKENVN